MISKGTTIDYGDCIEVYRGVHSIMVWYRRNTPGLEWPSMSYMMVPNLYF